jgi:hypothetical protein
MTILLTKKIETMKNILKLLFALLFVVNFSCHDSENIIDGVLDNETGAILRTISLDNGILNSSDPASEFLVTVEYQDEADGALLSEVRVSTYFLDLSTENGDTPESAAYVYTVPVSAFTTDTPHGLPRAQLGVTTAQVLEATGLTTGPDVMVPGDAFVIQFEAVLTDGRTFGPESAGSSVTGGYFASPFEYSALLTCSPEPGDYLVQMYDGYGDGWQSTGFEVCVDDNCQDVTLASGNFGEDTVSVPVGSGVLSWNWAGDSYPNEVFVVVYAPDGTLLFFGTGLDPSEMSLYTTGAYPEAVWTATLNTPESPDYGKHVAMSVGLQPITLCAQ